MPTKSEEYLAHAKECERLAELTADQTAKESLKAVAMEWLKLAQQVERYRL